LESSRGTIVPPPEIGGLPFQEVGQSGQRQTAAAHRIGQRRQRGALVRRLGRERAGALAGDRVLQAALDLLELQRPLRLVGARAVVAAEAHDRPGGCVPEAEVRRGPEPQIQVGSDPEAVAVAADRVEHAAVNHGRGVGDHVVHAHEYRQQLVLGQVAAGPAAARAALGVDHLGVAVDHAGVGIGVEHGHLAGQPVGQHQVVVGQVGDQLAAGLVQAAVPVADHAQIGLVAQVADARVGEPGHHLRRLVGRGVVADQQLEVGERLAQAARDRLAQVAGAVARGQRDRDPGRAHAAASVSKRFGSAGRANGSGAATGSTGSP
jgi:hypothetical protein